MGSRNRAVPSPTWGSYRSSLFLSSSVLWSQYVIQQEADHGKNLQIVINLDVQLGVQVKVLPDVQHDVPRVDVRQVVAAQAQVLEGLPMRKQSQAQVQRVPHPPLRINQQVLLYILLGVPMEGLPMRKESQAQVRKVHHPPLRINQQQRPTLTLNQDKKKGKEKIFSKN